MAEETDGIEEAFEGQLRVLVTAAGQLGERVARMREQQLTQARAVSEQQGREYAMRLHAERGTARAELAQVHREEWWAGADADAIGHAYTTAHAWEDQDPDAFRAASKIRTEVRERYGVDVDNAGADPAAVRAAVERAEHDRAQGDAERTRAAGENAEAVWLMQQAGRDDARAEQARAAAEHEPDPDERARAAAEAEQGETTADDAREDGRTLYDSAERRSATASDLEAKGIDREVVATRMRADVSQAKPATEAVKAGSAAKSPKARKARGRGAQVQRTGLDR